MFYPAQPGLLPGLPDFQEVTAPWKGRKISFPGALSSLMVQHPTLQVAQREFEGLSRRWL
jgi:hypothetical protein